MISTKPPLLLILLAFVSHFLVAQNQDAVKEIDSLNNYVFSRLENEDINKAETIVVEALEKAEKIGYHKGRADALLKLGIVQNWKDNHKNAIGYLLSAIKLYDSLGDTRHENYGKASIVLAAAFQRTNDLDRSLLYAHRGLALAKRIENVKTEGLSSRLLGETFLLLENYDSSKFYLNKALSAFQKINNPSYINSVYTAFGFFYYQLNDLEKALDYSLKSLEIVRELRLESNYPVAYVNIGEFHYLLKSYNKALQALDSAEHYAKVFESGLILSEAYRFKASVHSKLGNTDSALHYFEKTLALKDSLNSDGYKKELASVQTQLELYKHEAENKLLVKDKDIAVLERNLAIAGTLALVALLAIVIIRNKLKIQKSIRNKLEEEVRLRTQDILEQNKVIEQSNLKLQLSLNRAKVDPHFIFNVLNSVQHLILEREPLDASNHLAKVSRLTRYVLEKSSLNEVTLSEEVSMLEQYIQLEQFRLDYKFQYTIKKNVSGDVVLPAMLLQPYVENAILHGLAPASNKHLVLHIEMEEVNGVVKIVIHDNGVGRKFKAHSETHNSIGSTLGVERLQILSKVHNERFNVGIEDLSDGNGRAAGTKVSLEIPLRIRNVA